MKEWEYEDINSAANIVFFVIPEEVSPGELPAYSMRPNGINDPNAWEHYFTLNKTSDDTGYEAQPAQA